MKKFSMLAFVVSTSLCYGGDVNLGDVSARLDSIEKRLNGQDPSGEELATKTEMVSVRNDVKYLTGRIESLERQLQKGQIHPEQSSMSMAQKPYRSDPMEENSDSEQESQSDDDVADLLKDLEKSAPTPKQEAKQKERDQATEEADKKAPTAKLEKSSASGSYDEAQEAYRHQDYETAQQMFSAFAKQNPKDNRAKDAEYWALESRLKQAEQDKSKPMAKKSASELASYIKTNKDSKKTPLAIFALGRALKVQGDTDKACVAFKKAKLLAKSNKIDNDVEKSLDDAIKGCKK